jgi:hypothetical protein
MRITGKQLRRIIQEEVRRMVIKEAAVATPDDLGRMVVRLFELIDQADPSQSNPIIMFNYPGAPANDMQTDMIPLSRLQATVVITKEGPVTSSVVPNALSIFVGAGVEAQVLLKSGGKTLAPEYIDQDAVMDVNQVLASEFAGSEAGLLQMLGGKPRVDIPVKLPSNLVVAVG